MGRGGFREVRCWIIDSWRGVRVIGIGGSFLGDYFCFFVNVWIRLRDGVVGIIRVRNSFLFNNYLKRLFLVRIFFRFR